MKVTGGSVRVVRSLVKCETCTCGMRARKNVRVPLGKCEHC